MFRSLASSLISLFIVILSGFLLLFIWSGSEAITFERTKLDGDRELRDLVALQQKPSNLLDPEQVAGMDTFRVGTPGAGGGDSDMTPAAAPVTPMRNSGGGGTSVLWLSVAGFRGDYMDKSETPFMDQMSSAGGYTHKFKNVFPTLTYPSHVSQATGVPVDQHGIVGDNFKADGKGETLKSPTDPSLLRAEPIWTTATRQGVRVIVQGWPMSQNQTGENAAAYFDTEPFDPEMSDEDRLNKLLDTWITDSDPNKPRLVMARLNSLNVAGKKNGPRGDKTYEAVTAFDKMLEEFFKKLEEKWSEIHPDGDLVVFLTTDHGLTELQKNIHLPSLLGDKIKAPVEFVANQSMASLFFTELPAGEEEKAAILDEADRELNQMIYWRSFKPEELPEEWHYKVDDRIGDRVLVLKNGFAFSDTKASEPVYDPAEGDGIFGAYGYPVEDSIRMAGTAIIWGFPSAPRLGSREEIDALSIYPTICKLLGIEPAEGVTGEALPVN